MKNRHLVEVETAIVGLQQAQIGEMEAGDRHEVTITKLYINKTHGKGKRIRMGMGMEPDDGNGGMNEDGKALIIRGLIWLMLR